MATIDNLTAGFGGDESCEGYPSLNGEKKVLAVFDYAAEAAREFDCME